MPKLPRGMFKRGSSFYTRIHRGGRDRWVSLGGSYEHACRRLQELRGFEGQGSLPDPSASVRMVAKTWLAVRVATSRNERGLRLARTRVEKYLEPYMGTMKLSSVTPDDLRQYRLWLERKSISAQTVKHLLSDARCFFYWCEDSGYIEKAPVPRRLLPRIQEKPPERLTDVEIAKLTSLPEPYGFVARLGIGTGLRWGELCRAQASDVERGMLVVSQTKSGRVRRVPLSPELLAELRQHVGRLVPFSYESKSSLASMIRRESGVKRFHLHLMRHTFACRWLEDGGNLAALQLILGHQSITTTQRYARLTDEVVSREAARLARQKTVAGP